MKKSQNRSKRSKSKSARRTSANRSRTANRSSKFRNTLLQDIRNRRNTGYENTFALPPPPMKRDYSIDPDRFDLDVPNMVFHDNAAQSVVHKPIYSKAKENNGSAPSLIRAWTSDNRGHGVPRSRRDRLPPHQRSDGRCEGQGR